LLKELSSGKPVLELALLILIRGIGFSTPYLKYRASSFT
jgi:hypothetical protein